MKISLVSPRLALQKGDFLGSGVPYWPLELAVFAAFLEKAGESVAVIDLFGEDVRSLEDKGDHYLQGRSILDCLTESRICGAEAFVVFALSWMAHQELLFIVRTLRWARPEVPILILENSQAVTAYALDAKAEEFFSNGANGVICGEPYWNWAELRAFLLHPGAARPGVNMLTPGSGLRPGFGRRIEKNAAYPSPAWNLFPLAAYWSLPYAHGPKTPTFLPILTSRGCPYPCDFCVVPKTNDLFWRGRPPENVVDEMLELRDRFGVRDFQIEDLNPTINPARTSRLCELLIEKKAGVRFYIVSGTKAETVKLDQVGLLAEAGCRYLSISPESGSLKVLRAIGKSFDHAHALELIRLCHRQGIATQACFLSGHPAEQEDDHRQSKDYLRQLVQAGLDEAAVFVVAPLPGSGLFERHDIAIDHPELLVSFTPKGRMDWEAVSARRSELIRLFFLERLKRGAPLFAQGWRALIGRPRTKMENLPRRAAYVYGLIAAHRFSRRREKPVPASIAK